MTIGSLKELLEKDGISLETEEMLLDLIGSRASGDLSQEEDKKVREILEWEKDSLNTKADFYDDLANAADVFSEELEEKETSEPDYDAVIDEFSNDREKDIENLKKVMQARIDLIGSDL